MASSWKRLLRLRGLQAELAGAELAAAAARLGEIEAASDRAAAEARASRERWFGVVRGGLARVEVEAVDGAGDKAGDQAGDQAGDKAGDKAGGGTGEGAAQNEAAEKAGGVAIEGLVPAGSSGGGVEAEGVSASAGEALERMEAEAAWELAVWRRGRAELRRPGQEAEVERARAGWLDRRRERMQVETLVGSEAAAEQVAAERREQRELDDWRQSRLRAGGGEREWDLAGLEDFRPS